MIEIKVTYYPIPGSIVLSSALGHTTLQGSYEEWQAQQLARMLDAEFKVWSYDGVDAKPGERR